MFRFDETKLVNEDLNLIYKLNNKNKVAVVTPHGLTERFEIDQLVMQEENFASRWTHLERSAWSRTSICLDTLSPPCQWLMTSCV